MEEMNVLIGEPVWVNEQKPDLAVIEAMYTVARLLPEELRGPFRFAV